ncbi:MAG: PID-CTERM protein-sorting domain-containing protein [Bacteroidota bacterium]
MTIRNLKYLIALVALIIVATASAQVPDPPGGSAPPCGEPFGTVCPIDGGVSFLIAAGVALGGKKAYELRKKSLKNK